MCKEDSGRTRWGFWLKGKEDVLNGVILMISGRRKSGPFFRGCISEGAQPLKRRKGMGKGGMMVDVGPSMSSEGTCDDLGVAFDVNLKVMCWNVCGCSNLDVCQLGRGVDHTDIRSLVLNLM